MSSGGRTRTPNDWTRTSCVANYTTPEGGPRRASMMVAGADRGPETIKLAGPFCLEGRFEAIGTGPGSALPRRQVRGRSDGSAVEQAGHASVPDDATDVHHQRLAQESPEARRGARRGHLRIRQAELLRD